MLSPAHRDHGFNRFKVAANRAFRTPVLPREFRQRRHVARLPREMNQAREPTDQSLAPHWFRPFRAEMGGHQKGTESSDCAISASMAAFSAGVGALGAT
jgi:hypothetical protein